MKKVLIVGGAGYLGSVLCQMLLNKGYKVRVLDNLTYGDYGIKDIYSNKNFELMHGDIRDISDIMESIKDVDAVIHLAALVGDAASNLSPEETIEINHICTKTIAGLCKYKGIKRFIFASSASVYGSNLSDELLTETSEVNPLSLYAKMKLKSENSLLSMVDDDFSPVILRMGTLYGKSPRMRFDLVINLFTMLALRENTFHIFGGEQRRTFCHVKDAASAYIKCLESPIEDIHGEIFNVATQNYSIIEIGKMITSKVKGSNMILDDKDYDRRDYITSADKIINKLNFGCHHTISDGIDEMIESNQEWVEYKNSIYDNYKHLKLRGLRSYYG